MPLPPLPPLQSSWQPSAGDDNMRSAAAGAAAVSHHKLYSSHAATAHLSDSVASKTFICDFKCVNVIHCLYGRLSAPSGEAWKLDWELQSPGEKQAANSKTFNQNSSRVFLVCCIGNGDVYFTPCFWTECDFGVVTFLIARCKCATREAIMHDLRFRYNNWSPHTNVDWTQWVAR